MALSWVVVVDAVPATSRPVVGGTAANSELDLLFGTNGFGRLNGATASPALPSKPGQPGDTTESAAAVLYGDSGHPGALRLVDGPLGGQAGWPLALAAAGLVAGLAELTRRRNDPRLASVLLWGGWLGAEVVVLSFAGGLFHAYYLSAMAPALAALAGTGSFALMRAWRGRQWTAALVPVALVGTGLIEWRALMGYPTFRGLGPFCLAITVLASALLTASLIAKRLRRAARVCCAAAVVLACMAPLAWTMSVLRHAGVSEVPAAGPPLDPSAAALSKAEAQARTHHEPLTVVNSVAHPGGEQAARLIAFLETNNHGARWALAMPTGLDAAPIIARSGLGVIALGGNRQRRPS